MIISIMLDSILAGTAGRWLPVGYHLRVLSATSPTFALPFLIRPDSHFLMHF